MGITGQGPLKGPGLAEIKPESPAGIRAGLDQLRDYVWQSKYARGTKPSLAALKAGRGRWGAWARGKEPDRQEVWLITYQPVPDRVSPTHVRVVAHEVDRNKLPEVGPLPPTQSLVLYKRTLGDIRLDKFIPFPSPQKQPDMFGLAVEDLVRKEFGKIYKRANYRGRIPGRKGPDVLWRELGDLFRELADETGDGYWREVANELAQGA